MCIYEFVGPLYAWSYKENNCSCHYLVLLQTNLQCVRGRNWFNSFKLFITRSSDHHRVFTYIWQECNGFSKGIFHPHLRPFIGGQTQVLEWIKGNQNNHVVSKRFHYWDQTALRQSGCSVCIFTAPGALKSWCDWSPWPLLQLAAAPCLGIEYPQWCSLQKMPHQPSCIHLLHCPEKTSTICHTSF